MRQELISKRTRIEFREFLVSWTLAEIQIEFESVGIACDTKYTPSESGQRRSYVEQFYHSLDFAKPGDVKRLLSAFANILQRALQKADAAKDQMFQGPQQAEALRKSVTALIGWLKTDGFVYDDGCISPIDPQRLAEPRTVSELTRRAIFDLLSLRETGWSGRFSQDAFLGRLYDLTAMPSHDHRYPTAEGDVYKHTVLNEDWPHDWLLTDGRFDLLHATDEVFLRFLAETVHPGVRPDEKEVSQLVEELNKLLTVDGWCLSKQSELSGRPIYRGQRTTAVLDYSSVHAVAQTLDAGHMAKQINRMRAAATDDPDLAIGTAKEFIETVCKTILAECNVTVDKNDDVPKLIKKTVKQLKLAPDDVAESSKGAETVRILLSNLGSVAIGLAELRNMYGSGHGKHAKAKGLTSRHAKLAVGAATTLGTFLFDTLEHRRASPPKA